MSEATPPQALLRPYVIGFICCLLAALGSQPGLPGPGSPAHPMASTFTGITLLLGAFLYWKLPRRMSTPLPAGRWILVTLACLIPCLLGWALALDGGLLRHARTFTLLPPLMFVAFAPRPQRQVPLSGHAHE